MSLKLGHLQSHPLINLRLLGSNIILASVFMAGYGYFFKVDSASLLPHFWVCPWHFLTGWLCPGCGMSRAFICIPSGEFKKAWDLNPIALPLYSLIVIGIAFPKTTQSIYRTTPKWIAVLLLAGSLLFAVGRNIS